jgi:hypothetical protein
VFKVFVSVCVVVCCSHINSACVCHMVCSPACINLLTMTFSHVIYLELARLIVSWQCVTEVEGAPLLKIIKLQSMTAFVDSRDIGIYWQCLMASITGSVSNSQMPSRIWVQQTILRRADHEASFAFCWSLFCTPSAH